MYFAKFPSQKLVHFSPSLENGVPKNVLIDPIEQTSKSDRKYLIYVSSGLSMPLLSRVPCHLRERIGEIQRGLSSPPIPLFSSFSKNDLALNLDVRRIYDPFHDTFLQFRLK